MIQKIKKWIITIIIVGLLLSTTLNHSLAISNNSDQSITTKSNTQRQLTIELSGLINTQFINVTLSESDAQKVQEILDGVDGQLQNVKTTKEKYQVYNLTVSQLYQYGIFGNLTLSQAQELATYWYNVGQRYKRYDDAQYLINKNAFCLVSGRTNYTYTGHRFTIWMQGGGAILLMLGLVLLMEPYYPPHATNYPILGLLLAGTGFISFALGVALAFRADMTPIAIGDLFGIGFYYGSPDDIWYASGWVNTLGLLGYKNWSGELLGNLPGKFPLDFIIITYSAIWGFTGIKIWINEDGSEKSFLGSALAVGLNEKS